MHFVEGELDSKSDERAFLNKKNMAIVMQFYTYKIQEDLLLNHKEMKLYKAHCYREVEIPHSKSTFNLNMPFRGVERAEHHETFRNLSDLV